MRQLKPTGFVLGLIALLIFVTEPRVVETVAFNADNIRVIDADTIAAGASSVRLKGIGAPERGQDLHNEGKEFLGRLLRSSERVTCDLTNERTHGRRVGRCYLFDTDGNRTDIQRAVVGAGYASPLIQYGGWRYIPAALLGS